jgi:hypothetical protein
MFGLNFSAAQRDHVEELLTRFSKGWVLLDQEAKLLSLRMIDRLRGLRRAELPLDVKDPDALTNQQAGVLLSQLG